jgi:hypothetical protein
MNNPPYIVQVIMPDGTRRTFKGHTYPYDDPSFNRWLAENGANVNWIRKSLD